MRKINFKKVKKAKPSILEYTGKHKLFESEMQLFVYDELTEKEYTNLSISDFERLIDVEKTNWLNLHGLNDLKIVEGIANFFKIDNFLLADVLNIHRRTKLEELSDTLFFNVKSLLPTENSDNIDVEQISFLIKGNVLISFQEKRSDFFTHIRERLRTNQGLVRTKHKDYLLFLLLEAIIENFYITIENEENKIEHLISISKTSADPEILIKIEKHRDNLNFLKRSIIPLRDSLFAIKSLKGEDYFTLIDKDTFSFFARLHQKTLEILEQIESDLGMLDGASNFYFSSQAHKMNEIMKTLTVISAIFIPLTFIVGVYGMNFENMPELKYEKGYYIIIGIMLVIGLLMLAYFKRRKWF